MKRIYPRAKTRPGRVSRAIALFIFLALLLLFLRNYSGGILEIERTPLKFVSKMRDVFGSLQNFLGSKSALISEVETLKNEKLDLENKNALLAENLNAASYASELFGSEENHGKPALVLQSGTQQSPFDTLSVDAGLKDGVQAGFKAAAFGVYLGQVTDVSNGASKIRLISFPGERTSGYLEPEAINMTLEGMGAGNLKFIAPKSLGIKIGDKIFTDSRPAYLMGQVEYIKEESAEPLEEVRVRTPINLESLRFIELKYSL